MSGREEVLEGVWWEEAETGCRDEFHSKFGGGETRTRILVHFREGEVKSLCLGCGVSFSVMGEEKIAQVKEETHWLQAYEKKSRIEYLGNQREKWLKLKLCVLCGEKSAGRSGGLRLCEEHLRAVEAKGGL